VARRRIQDHVDPAGRQARTGAVRHPGVFTDLESDPHAATVESEVADRQGRAVDREPIDPAPRPGPKPARLIVNALAGEVLLADDAGQPAVGQERNGIVDGVLEPHRQADRHGHAPRLRQDLAEHPPGHPLDAG